MTKAEIGVWGLGIMGENLIYNIENKGYSVIVYNRSKDKLDQFQTQIQDKKRIQTCNNVQAFCHTLKKPRKIILMIKAGPAIDEVIESLLEFLEEEDILIDGGNSQYKDTIRRYHYLQKEKIHFMGVGISGGAEGARKGPAIMPGGSKKAWLAVEDILKAISAKVDDDPCCDYLGTDGAGHYVKMIHNGIEYIFMQLIAETFHLLKTVFGLKTTELGDIYNKWNEGELNSYLLTITSNIMNIEDTKTNQPLLDLISDAAQQKGTGIWTVQEALDIGVAVPSISTSVFQRIISSRRAHLSKVYKSDLKSQNKPITINDDWMEHIRKSLYCALIASFSQGFSLLREGSKRHQWDLNLPRIALLWRGGCIIRIRFLNDIASAFTNQPDLEELLQNSFFAEKINIYFDSWKKVLKLALESGVPVPGLYSTFSYFRSINSEWLPTNLIQAQRDYFGAHNFMKIGEIEKKFYHFEDWPEVED